MARDIADILKSMDKASLKKGIEDAKRFLATPDGKKAVEMLKKGEMPDGGAIPGELRGAAEALSKDPSSAKMLAQLFEL